jgi:putative serine protease PepD
MGADASAGPAGSVPAVDRTGDDDDDVDGGLPLSPPLHPDDRLWRHPSELASAGVPLAAQQDPEGGRTRGTTGRWLPVVLAGTVGALLAAGLLTLTGGLGGDATEPAAVAPSSTLALAISSPVAPPGLADLAERLEPSLFAVTATSPDGRATRGSGVAIRSDHVLTAARVVGDAREVQVLVRGHGRRATVVGADPDTDLALLSVEGGGLVPAAWGEAAALRPGDPAFTVSSPPASEPGPTVTAGIVSGIARTMAYAGTELRGLLQLDRPVPPEGGGGALLDRAGALVGITLSAPFGSAAFGYAVPAEVAREVSRQLLTRGRVTHTWLGVEGGDRGMNGGAVVQRVKPGSPAARSGLQDGDVVTEVNGDSTPTMATLLAELRLHQPGDTVRLRVLRGEQPMEVLVTLADRP